MNLTYFFQVRRSFKLDDGATVYYDTFDPPFTRATATIVVVPGKYTLL